LVRDFENMDFLKDQGKFQEIIAELDKLNAAKRKILLQRLEERLVGSSWVSTDLFKPGMRNLYLQEKLGGLRMFQKFVNFLGDQYYHFKFFFQNKIKRGVTPKVNELLNQAINMPNFRFRLEAIDLAIEFQGEKALPQLFNLINGLDKDKKNARLIIKRLQVKLDEIATLVSGKKEFERLFRDFRLKMIELEGWT